MIKPNMRRIGIGCLRRLCAALYRSIQHLLQAVCRGQCLGIHGQKAGNSQHGIENDGKIA